MELEYSEDLMKNLSELNGIEKELTKLGQKKEIIREKIRKWMNMHELDEYETFDSNGDNLWRMTLKDSERRSANINELEQILEAEDFERVVSISKFTTFKVQTVKSKKKSSAAPKPPKATS